MGAWPQDKREGNLGERNGGNLGGSQKAAIQAHAKQSKWRTYRILFGSRAKAVRDGRAKWRGKREKYKNTARECVPVPINAVIAVRCTRAVTLILDSTLYGK